MLVKLLKFDVVLPELPEQGDDEAPGDEAQEAEHADNSGQNVKYRSIGHDSEIYTWP